MNETHIRIAAKLFDARDSMRRLHGKNWTRKIKEISPIICGVAKEGKISILGAAIQIAEKAIKDGQPMASVMVLAVACELSENSEDEEQQRSGQPDAQKGSEE